VCHTPAPWLRTGLADDLPPLVGGLPPELADKTGAGSPLQAGDEGKEGGEGRRERREAGRRRKRRDGKRDKKRR